MNVRYSVAALFSIAAIAGLFWFLNWGEPASTPEAGGEPLVVFCAAGVMPPIKAAADEYTRDFGVAIQLQPGDSGTLLAGIAAAPDKGDVYIAGDSGFTDTAHAKGLVAERIPLATMMPVIAVRKGNPKRVLAWSDLSRDDLKVGLGRTDGPAVGKAAKKLLARAGLWGKVSAAVQSHGTYAATVPELANAVKLGSLDAAIVFDAVARQYSELEISPAPTDPSDVQHITAAVVAKSRRAATALHFARWLASRDKGLRHVAANHYAPVSGDEWVDRPRIKLLSGNILRPAVEQTIREFEARENCTVLVNYNGCGTLVSQMKAGEKTDAYFACDTSFLTQVADRFGAGVDISRTRMVIAVPKGNPKGIKTLADLETTGLKIGLADGKFSALGELTDNLLRRTGHYEKVNPNVVARFPTADFLVSQMKTGHLDATIVYEVNAVRVLDVVDMVVVAGPATIAVQPIAVAVDSKHPLLTGRLVDAIAATQSRERFKTSGFEWMGK